MAFDIIAKEESISIINVDFHEDRSFLLPESAHQNRRGRRRYLGPNYLALDVVSTRSSSVRHASKAKSLPVYDF